MPTSSRAQELLLQVGSDWEAPSAMLLRLDSLWLRSSPWSLTVPRHTSA